MIPLYPYIIVPLNMHLKKLRASSDDQVLVFCLDVQQSQWRPS